MMSGVTRSKENLYRSLRSSEVRSSCLASNQALSDSLLVFITGAYFTTNKYFLRSVWTAVFGHYTDRCGNERTVYFCWRTVDKTVHKHHTVHLLHWTVTGPGVLSGYWTVRSSFRTDRSEHIHTVYCLCTVCMMFRTVRIICKYGSSYGTEEVFCYDSSPLHI